MNDNEKIIFLKEYEKESKESISKEDAIINASLKVKIDEENSNRLLVYVGSYKVEKFPYGGAKEIPTYDGDPKAKYKRYIDAETQTSYNINMEEVEEFENNPKNKIIYREVKMINLMLLHQNFWDVRQQFFEGIADKEPQEEIVLKLVNSSEK